MGKSKLDQRHSELDYCKTEKEKQAKISKETLEEVENRREVKAKGVNNQAEVENYKRQNTIIQQMMRKDKENHIIDQCQRIEVKVVFRSQQGY